MHVLHLTATLANKAEESSGGVIFDKAFFMDNLTAIGVIIGGFAAIAFLSKAHKSKMGEGLLTFGNVCIAGMIFGAFAIVCGAGPKLIAAIFPGFA